MRILGIDPGRFGALAHVELDTMSVLDLVDMPLITNRAGKTTPDPRELCRLMRAWQPDLVIIEHVQPLGRESAVNLWTFAEGFGALLAAAQIHSGSEKLVTLVRPSIWKTAMGLSSDKKQSLRMARENFPDAADMLTRIKDDGRAEALLLTLYHRDHVIPVGEVEVF